MYLETADTNNENHISTILGIKRDTDNIKYSVHNYKIADRISVHIDLETNDNNYAWIIWDGCECESCEYVSDGGCECTDDIAGMISLNNINWVNRNAELRFMIDKQHWNKGFATRAGNKVLNFAFNVLGLHKVWLGTASENTGMIKAAERMGMDAEGVLMDHLFINGKYQNVLRFCIFNDKFKRGSNDK